MQWQKREPLMMTMTEEELVAFYKTMEKDVLRRASYQDRLEGIPASELLKGIPASELLKGISIYDRLKNLTPDELRNLFNDKRFRDLLKSTEDQEAPEPS